MTGPHRRTPPDARRWAGLAGLLGMLAACERPADMTIVNGTDETVTAVFSTDGDDILDGETLPPGTFIRLPASASDGADPAELVAYTDSGACARGQGAPGGRWEIEAGDLGLSGC